MYGFSPAWQLVHTPPVPNSISLPPPWYCPPATEGTPIGITSLTPKLKPAPMPVDGVAAFWLSQMQTFDVTWLRQITPSSLTVVNDESVYRGSATHIPSGDVLW